MPVLTESARVQQQTEAGSEESLRIRPYRGPESERLPVEILSVKFEEQPLFYRITPIEIQNHSNKCVTGVSFKWVLIDKGEGMQQLGIGTPLFTPKRPLAPGEKAIIDLKDFRISKLFFRGAALGDKSWIGILLGNVLYSDGSSWRPRYRVWDL